MEENRILDEINEEIPLTAEEDLPAEEGNEREKKGRKKGLLIGGVILLCLAAIAAILYFAVFRPDSDGGETVYVDTVESFMGITGTGSGNRFSGVIETQDTWSVNLDPDSELKEVYVKAGDSVDVGTKLFSYDTEKIQSDLEQAKIDLTRLQNEKKSIEDLISQLTKEKKSAPSSQQGDYTIQIQEQQLALQQKELDIQSKEEDVKRLEASVGHATVESAISGVVKSVQNTNGSEGSNPDGAFITIMQTDSLRVKGTVNEQNIGELTEGCDVVVHSRVNAEDTWAGTITKIDTENAVSNSNEFYYDSGSSETTSSNYPFYVELENTDGLILGQHVYITVGTEAEEESDAFWIDEYLLDLSDPDSPFVWADNGKGKLEKREIKLGEYDGDNLRYQVLDGLHLKDKIAFPDGNLSEGMKTEDMPHFDEMTEEPGAMDENFGVEEDSGGAEEEF